jgi:hypothetical protein
MITTPLIVTGTETQHMIAGEERGMVFFICETQPLATLKTFGLPTKCPLCSMVNPISKRSI